VPTGSRGVSQKRMATTEPATRSSSEERESYSDRHVVPVLVLEFDDERTRGRMREAGLLSIIVHLLLFIAVITAPKYFPGKALKVWTAQELINRDRELTYLEMPKDSQSVSKRPNTDVISDKDRIATSRHPNPTLDRGTLERLRESAMARAPAAPPAPPQPATQGQAASPPPPRPNANENQLAQLQPPAVSRTLPNVFGRSALSPGAAIEQAERAAAARRGAGGGGDYGGGIGGIGRGGSVQGNLEILSDTMGVDFGPYLARVLHDVRNNWYNLIPEVARAPLMKKGKVSIQFAILKDGSVAGMQLEAPSGDVSLDRAAWGGITASNPFPPLPSEFGGQYLALRFHFYYNPDRRDLE
jgi:TonB family protein